MPNLKEMLDSKVKSMPEDTDDESAEEMTGGPTVQFTNEQLSELPSWEEGQDYYLVVKATLSGKTDEGGTFTLKEVGSLPEKEGEEEIEESEGEEPEEENESEE